MKKEKREAKSSTPAKEPSTDSLSPTLVDPALVLVVGVVDGQSTSRSPGLSEQLAEKKRKAEGKKSTSSKSVKPDKAVKSSSSRPLPSTSTDQEKSASSQPSTSSSTDSRFAELDQKWSDQFNRLEALLMARTLDRPQDPTFSIVKVAPTHTLPANEVRTEPFLKPTNQPPQLTDRPSAAELLATDPAKHRSATKSTTDAAQSSEPTCQQTSQRHLASAFDTTRKDCSSSSDSESDSLSSDRPPVDICVEEVDYSATTSDDNPFAGPNLQTPGKVSVNLPTDEWLCRKMRKLNLTLVQGYPTRISEAGGLLRTSLCARPNGKGNDMVCTPTRRRTLLTLFPHGTLALHT